MLYLLVNWGVSALSLMVVAHVISGFRVQSFGAALLAALVIGLINATLGLLLKILTLPLTIITFGLFLLVDQRAHAAAGLVGGPRLRGDRLRSGTRSPPSSSRSSTR